MMQDLKNALNGGGQQLDNLENTVAVEDEQIEPVTEFTQEEAANTATEVNESAENTSTPTDYVKKEEEDKKE
jgi:hypothetical protein